MKALWDEESNTVHESVVVNVTGKGVKTSVSARIVLGHDDSTILARLHSKNQMTMFHSWEPTTKAPSDLTFLQYSYVKGEKVSWKAWKMTKVGKKFDLKEIEFDFDNFDLIETITNKIEVISDTISGVLLRARKASKLSKG